MTQIYLLIVLSKYRTTIIFKIKVHNHWVFSDNPSADVFPCTSKEVLSHTTSVE